MDAPYCIRCIEEHEDEEGKKQKGEQKQAVHLCCNICSECEHAVDCVAKI